MELGKEWSTFLPGATRKKKKKSIAHDTRWYPRLSVWLWQHSPVNNYHNCSLSLFIPFAVPKNWMCTRVWTILPLLITSMSLYFSHISFLQAQLTDWHTRQKGRAPFAKILENLQWETCQLRLLKHNVTDWLVFLIAKEGKKFKVEVMVDVWWGVWW